METQGRAREKSQQSYYLPPVLILALQGDFSPVSRYLPAKVVPRGAHSQEERLLVGPVRAALGLYYRFVPTRPQCSSRDGSRHAAGHHQHVRQACGCRTEYALGWVLLSEAAGPQTTAAMPETPQQHHLSPTPVGDTSFCATFHYTSSLSFLSPLPDAGPPPLWSSCFSAAIVHKDI